MVVCNHTVAVQDSFDKGLPINTVLNGLYDPWIVEGLHIRIHNKVLVPNSGRPIDYDIGIF